MKPVEVEFLRRLVADRPGWRVLGKISGRLSDLEGIGSVSHARVNYSPADFEKAKNTLLTRGFPLESPQAGFARSQAPAGGSEKTRARAVMAELVAVVPLNMPAVNQAPAQGFLAIPVVDATAMPFEILLVCENLEPLMHIRDYEWLDEFISGRRTLAVFRGKPHLFNTAAAAILIEDLVLKRPTLAFYDFDPKGLCMAESLPRREALCLPEWSVLEAATRAAARTNLFTQSAHVSVAQLNATADPTIFLAWSRLKHLMMGLDQEGFPRMRSSVHRTDTNLSVDLRPGDSSPSTV